MTSKQAVTVIPAPAGAEAEVPSPPAPGEPVPTEPGTPQPPAPNPRREARGPDGAVSAESAAARLAGPAQAGPKGGPKAPNPREAGAAGAGRGMSLG